MKMVQTWLWKSLSSVTVGIMIHQSFSQPSCQRYCVLVHTWQEMINPKIILYCNHSEDAMSMMTWHKMMMGKTSSSVQSLCDGLWLSATLPSPPPGIKTAWVLRLGTNSSSITPTGLLFSLKPKQDWETSLQDKILRCNVLFSCYWVR